MATVRRLLTEILLSVTNSEISAVVREAMEEEETSKHHMISLICSIYGIVLLLVCSLTEFKFKIPALPKRALKTTSILGE